ncbi:type II toxin-antitoxin system VapC family toxin [Candidatus Woesearchaeota archaeon]|nr:type II toxin-antitoxin system VapC family toxin [Candidatus Woesearchaeota archaeon]
MKLYLDTDVFLALLKEEDRHKKAAIAFFEKYSAAEKTTSTVCCLEIWFYLYKNGQQKKMVDALRAVAAMCTVQDFNAKQMGQAVFLSAENRLSPADALHAVLAADGADAIVSSDASFDRIASLKRIDFTN